MTEQPDQMTTEAVGTSADQASTRQGATVNTTRRVQLDPGILGELRISKDDCQSIHPTNGMLIAETLKALDSVTVDGYDAESAAAAFLAFATVLQGMRRSIPVDPDGLLAYLGSIAAEIGRALHDLAAGQDQLSTTETAAPDSPAPTGASARPYSSRAAAKLSDQLVAGMAATGYDAPDSALLAEAIATTLPDLDPHAIGASLLALANATGNLWGRTGCNHLVDLALTIGAAGHQLYTQDISPAAAAGGPDDAGNATAMGACAEPGCRLDGRAHYHYTRYPGGERIVIQHGSDDDHLAYPPSGLLARGDVR
jgi:hypothetical protein